MYYIIWKAREALKLKNTDLQVGISLNAGEIVSMHTNTNLYVPKRNVF